ncbi:MAG: WhiB family transcriptional regulator [Nocardioidaceae bacterium]|nr:WhiB family transcriptional regulator [Nocardioidaceae bacterium]
MAKLTDLREAGERIPCVGDDRWISDDRQAQAEAAQKCAGCPALAACGSYFERWPEPGGVWAGLTERARDGRAVGRRKKVAG